MEKKILIALGSLVVLSMTFLSFIWLTQDSTEAEQEVNQRTLIEVDESKKGQSLDGLGERQSESTESNKEYIINPRTYEVLPSDGEETEDKEILLTFDDAPAGYALDIANLLFEQDVPAIFFVNGHFLKSEEQEAVLKEIYNMGFEIANHTYNHPVLPRLSTENQRKEIVDLNKRIEEIISEKPRFFRAPYGENTPYATQLAIDKGMVPMNWTLDYDTKPAFREAGALVQQTLTSERLKDGANILMHDRSWTYEALPAMLDGFREQGYKFIDPKDILGMDDERVAKQYSNDEVQDTGNSDGTASDSGVQPEETAEKTNTHIVQPGETLYSISNLYGMTIEEIQAINNIDDPQSLMINQELNVK